MTEKEIIQDLATQVVNIYFAAKNCHWFSKTYGNHLLFDRIADGLLDHLDALMETGLMSSEKYYPITFSVVTADNVNHYITTLWDMLQKLLDSIQASINVFPEAVKNELSGLSQDVQTKINLLSMVE